MMTDAQRLAQAKMERRARKRARDAARSVAARCNSTLEVIRALGIKHGDWSDLCERYRVAVIACRMLGIPEPPPPPVASLPLASESGERES